MSADLGAARYVSITTYRRTGVGVATTVWLIEVDGKLYASTGSHTGKVKRIRNNPDVTVTVCDGRGRSTGASHKGVARIIPVAQHPEVEAALVRKYGIQKRLVNVLDKMRGKNSKSFGERILLELVLED
jgi:PPOX class probable F420-dependent enzyme